MQLTVYRLGDGAITHWLECPEEAVTLQIPPGQGLATIEGHFHPDEFAIIDGLAVPRSTSPAPMPWAVNAEAARRIDMHYPAWKQANVLRAGTPEQIETMGTYIDSVRGASNLLSPAAQDYQDDRHWPSPPTA